MFSNISRSKGNQVMKFGQSIEYDKRNIFLQKLFEKSGKKTSWTPVNFLFCKRTLYDVKVSGQFNIFW